MATVPIPAICLVTSGALRDPTDDLAAALVQLLAQAAEAGVNLIQIREPALGDRALLSLAHRVLDEVNRSHTSILLNERTDVALACGADGVHLRADAMPASRVRTLVPDGFLVGRSVHTVAEAVAAEADGGTDYLIFGTVFSTSRKPQDQRVAGVAELHKVCASVRLPVIAIGGIDVERATDVAAAGAAGMAAIGMFADIPADDSNRMREVVQHARRAFQGDVS